jgi:hypothetical protein
MIQYQVYFKVPGGDWVHLEDTLQLFHKLSDELRAALDYFSIYQWRVDTYDTETELTTTGDTWAFISQKPHSFTTYTRRSDYNEDQVWTPATGWVGINELTYTGGGRYNNQFVAIGKGENEQGVVYFGEM